MKPGHGHALFTAECSHTFHFSCIASNVSYGNLVCPVCRATWKEVPCQALLVNRHRLGSRSSSSTYRNTTPPPQQPVASTHGIGYGELPALIREHDEQRPSRYSLKPVLRRLDESIARFQAAQATEKQIKAEEREGGRGRKRDFGNQIHVAEFWGRKWWRKCREPWEKDGIIVVAS